MDWLYWRLMKSFCNSKTKRFTFVGTNCVRMCEKKFSIVSFELEFIISQSFWLFFLAVTTPEMLLKISWVGLASKKSFLLPADLGVTWEILLGRYKCCAKCLSVSFFRTVFKNSFFLREKNELIKADCKFIVECRIQTKTTLYFVWVILANTNNFWLHDLRFI